MLNTKDLDAIKRMVVRLQSIKETNILYIPVAIALADAKDLLQTVVDTYEPEKKDDSVR